ncbi:kelch-like protein 5 [Clonorchis sinensis]|uniref:Kelch-like protein 5 n=1 Tax=Clonorchis sinensis TaxID=79923 RepID=H2KT81_CLOSI|nr:kelch-like protein 5 [Clonorchis sinensis]
MDYVPMNDGSGHRRLRYTATSSEQHRKDGSSDLASLNEQLIQTFKTLQLFRQKSQFTDVTLCVGDENLPCHKVILAASSPYFHAMFSSPYKEQQTSHVLLEHVSPWAVRRLLDFAYLGVMELSETTVQDVFTAASLLDYPIAMKACVQFMEQHLDITNCLGVESLAELHGLTSLGKTARKMTIENFSTLVTESSEWPALPFSTILSYISSDDLDVPSEQSVWNACMTWIDHDPATRTTCLPALLSHVRLRHLGQDFLKTQLTQNCYIQAGNIMSTVYSYSPSLGLWSECCPMPQARARHAAVAVGSSHIFVFGGITLTQRGTDLSRNGGSDPLNVEDGRLDRIVPNSYQRTAGSVPIVNIANTIIRYDLCTDSWSTVGRSSQPRLESRVVVVDEGSGGGSLTASPPPIELSPCVVDCTFGPDGSNLSVSGELAASSNEVRSSGNFVRDNGHRRRHLSSHTHAERTLVEIGGVSETHPQGTDQVMLYSLRSDLTVIPTGDYIKLPQASRYINATVRQSSNLVYLFWERTSELSVLDLTRRTLRPLAPLTENHAGLSSTRIHCGLAWVGSQLYVVGGFSEFASDDRRPILPRDDVHCYDLERNSWSTRPDSIPAHVQPTSNNKLMPHRPSSGVCRTCIHKASKTISLVVENYTVQPADVVCCQRVFSNLFLFANKRLRSEGRYSFHGYCIVVQLEVNSKILWQKKTKEFILVYIVPKSNSTKSSVSVNLTFYLSTKLHVMDEGHLMFQLVGGCDMVFGEREKADLICNWANGAQCGQFSVRVGLTGTRGRFPGNVEPVVGCRKVLSSLISSTFFKENILPLET